MAAHARIQQARKVTRIEQLGPWVGVLVDDRAADLIRSEQRFDDHRTIVVHGRGSRLVIQHHSLQAVLHEPSWVGNPLRLNLQSSEGLAVLEPFVNGSARVSMVLTVDSGGPAKCLIRLPLVATERGVLTLAQPEPPATLLVGPKVWDFVNEKELCFRRPN